MTVKVNPDHVENEMTFRVGQDLHLIEVSCKSMHNRLHEAAQSRTEWHTNQPDRGGKYWRHSRSISL